MNKIIIGLLVVGIFLFGCNTQYTVPGEAGSVASPDASTTPGNYVVPHQEDYYHITKEQATHLCESEVSKTVKDGHLITDSPSDISADMYVLNCHIDGLEKFNTYGYLCQVIVTGTLSYMNDTNTKITKWNKYSFTCEVPWENDGSFVKCYQ